jgi:hypothetical protein
MSTSVRKLGASRFHQLRSTAKLSVLNKVSVQLYLHPGHPRCLGESCYLLGGGHLGNGLGGGRARDGLGGGRALLKPLALERLVNLALGGFVLRLVDNATLESRLHKIKARLISREDLRVVRSARECFAAHVLGRVQSVTAGQRKHAVPGDCFKCKRLASPLQVAALRDHRV